MIATDPIAELKEKYGDALMADPTIEYAGDGKILVRYVHPLQVHGANIYSEHDWLLSFRRSVDLECQSIMLPDISDEDLPKDTRERFNILLRRRPVAPMIREDEIDWNSDSPVSYMFAVIVTVCIPIEHLKAGATKEQQFEAFKLACKYTEQVRFGIHS